MLVVVVGVVDAAAAAALGVPYEGVKTVRLDLLLPSVTVANRTRRRQLALLRAATALRASPHRRARLSYPSLLCGYPPSIAQHFIVQLVLRL